MAVVLEGLGDRREEEDYEREDETGDELHRGAGEDEHADADEEQLRGGAQTDEL